MTPKAQATKAKISKWDYIKAKVPHSKGNNTEKGNLWNERKYLQIIYPIRADIQNI